MSLSIHARVHRACDRAQGDPTRMMDILLELQGLLGCISDQTVDSIADRLAIPRAEVESVVSFYAFFSRQPKGAIVLRLCDDIIDHMFGMEEVEAALCAELGIEVGETTADGRITLERTDFIGMADQAPAMMINSHVLTELNPERARHLARKLLSGAEPASLVGPPGDGNNGHPLVQAMVRNNVRHAGPLLAPFDSGAALGPALARSPEQVIAEVTEAGLLGCGGAGFATGRKWSYARQAPGADKVVICNADEGEPGTFKDRVLLTQAPHMLIEGMTVAAWAIGASQGILYLRGEYAYLAPFLESVLQERRTAGLLGVGIGGCLDFDVRIQLGAGAYICGEETALISSCEGKRGDPKTRPPFPAQRGYLGRPTVVNNVETLCGAARILERSADWWRGLGTGGCAGSKLFSVSGDCKRPGIYELPLGVPLTHVLELAGAEDAAAIQAGGPSGELVGPEDYHRRLSFDDLAPGGAIMAFGAHRDLLAVVAAFTRFFVDETCGYCTPCRAGNPLLLRRLKSVLAGRGQAQDLVALEELGRLVVATSRCGLGQSSPRPILFSLARFRHLYASLLQPDGEGLRSSFDLRAALAAGELAAGRPSIHLSEAVAHE